MKSGYEVNAIVRRSYRVCGSTHVFHFCSLSGKTDVQVCSSLHFAKRIRLATETKFDASFRIDSVAQRNVHTIIKYIAYVMKLLFKMHFVQKCGEDYV